MEFFMKVDFIKYSILCLFSIINIWYFRKVILDLFSKIIVF